MTVSETAALNVIETHTNNSTWEQEKEENDFGIISNNDYHLNSNTSMAR